MLKNGGVGLKMNSGGGLGIGLTTWVDRGWVLFLFWMGLGGLKGLMDWTGSDFGLGWCLFG